MPEDITEARAGTEAAREEAPAWPLVVDGIETGVMPGSWDDVDVLEALVDFNDPELTNDEHVTAMYRYMRLLYGDRYRQVKRDLREANGGALSIETMANFNARVLMAGGQKN